MQTVNWAGSSYNIPNQRGDTPWSGLSDFAIAVAAKGINTNGGAFTLLADINFGATFGLVSTYFKSRTANIATAGILRLASADTIQWRNNANGGDVSLSKNSSDELLWNSSRIILAGGGLIVNADISASAAIAFSKMAALTASRALQSSAGGVVEVSTVTTTELGYVSGVTSAIQTQLTARPTTGVGVANSLAYYTGAAAIAAVTAITASRALASDSNGLPIASATTATELGYVNGVTSAIQTQLNAKISNPLSADLDANSKNITNWIATKYRRPALTWASITTVSIETGLTGTSGEAAIIFPDGDYRVDSTAAHIIFNITRNAVFNGSNQSGLRASLSEATNTWYAIYAVKCSNAATDFVLVGDTVLPLQANFATLNSNFGTGGWRYLGMIRNGDNAGTTGDILDFYMSGNMTLLNNITNANATGFGGRGLRLATTAGATTLTYSYSSGTGTTDIPAVVGQVVWDASFGTTTGKLIFNAADTALYAMAGAASAVGQNSVIGPAAAGMQLKNGPGSSIAYTVQLAGFTDTVLGAGSLQLL